MTVLGWVAVLVGAWCVVSVLAALGLGALLRRGSLVDGELSGQGCGHGVLAMWLAEVPHIPDTPGILLDEAPAQRPRDVDSGFHPVLRS
jgi:hypothetical protein